MNIDFERKDFIQLKESLEACSERRVGLSGTERKQFAVPAARFAHRIRDILELRCNGNKKTLTLTLSVKQYHELIAVVRSETDIWRMWSSVALSTQWHEDLLQRLLSLELAAAVEEALLTSV